MNEITLSALSGKKAKKDFFGFIEQEDSETYDFLKSMRIWIPVLTLVVFLSFFVPACINNAMYQKWLGIEPKYTLKEFDAECTDVIKIPIPTSKDEDFKEEIWYRYSWTDGDEKYHTDTTEHPAELGDTAHIYDVTATKGKVAETIVTFSYDEINEVKDKLERKLLRYKADDAAGYLFIKEINYGAQNWFIVGALIGIIAFIPWGIVSFLTVFYIAIYYSKYKECHRKN